jgi:hypothetical protein
MREFLALIFLHHCIRYAPLTDAYAMPLSQNQKLCKVTYKYADGSSYETTGEDVENYQQNMNAAVGIQMCSRILNVYRISLMDAVLPWEVILSSPEGTCRPHPLRSNTHTQAAPRRMAGLLRCTRAVWLPQGPGDSSSPRVHAPVYCSVRALHQ